MLCVFTYKAELKPRLHRFATGWMISKPYDVVAGDGNLKLEISQLGNQLFVLDTGKDCGHVSTLRCTESNESLWSMYVVCVCVYVCVWLYVYLCVRADPQMRGGQSKYVANALTTAEIMMTDAFVRCKFIVHRYICQRRRWPGIRRACVWRWQAWSCRGEPAWSRCRARTRPVRTTFAQMIGIWSLQRTSTRKRSIPWRKWCGGHRKD